MTTGRSPSRSRRRMRVPVGRVPALRSACVATLLGLASCAPSPRIPVEVPPPPDPFERLPYLQSVQADSGFLRWRVRAGSPGLVRYRVEGGAWRTAAGALAPPSAGTGVGPGGGSPVDARATLRGLPPASRVEYTVETPGATSGPYGFRSAPTDTSGEAVRVLAFGDSGWGSEAQVRLAERMAAVDGWDLAVHVGDIAYDDGTETDFTQRHFRVYAELLARVPFFPVPGNHDVRSGFGAAYDRAFDWPGERSGRRYYAFRWGRVQFVGLDTSSDGELEALQEARGEQLAWLERTLGRAARDTTLRWTVVLTHHPLYSHAAGLAGHGPTGKLRKTLAPLFEAAGVDLVLQGHDHHYERSVPIRRHRPARRGCAPVYFVTGGGGAARFARSVEPGPLAARVSRRHHFLDLVFRAGAVEGVAVAPDGSAVDTVRILPFDPEDPTCPA